jgi:hypothetical protein
MGFKNNPPGHKRHPIMYYRMDETGGTPGDALDQGCKGYHLSENSGSIPSIGAGSSVVGTSRGPTGGSNHFIRNNTECCFDIHFGGTFAGWFQNVTQGPTTHELFGYIGQGGGYQPSWYITPSWPDPTTSGGQRFNAIQLYLANTDEPFGSSRVINISASEFVDTNVKFGVDVWTFVAARFYKTVDDVTMAFSIGVKGINEMVHKTALAVDPAGTYPRHKPPHLFRFSTATFDFNFDELGFYCCPMTDEDVEWVFNAGNGRQVL